MLQFSFVGVYVLAATILPARGFHMSFRLACILTVATVFCFATRVFVVILQNQVVVLEIIESSVFTTAMTRISSISVSAIDELLF